MRAVAHRLVWIIGLFCLVFGIAGVLAFSPVTIALSVTGWFLARASMRSIAHQGDINAPTPDLQYWARATLLRACGLMAVGAAIAFTFICFGVSFHLAWHTQAVLTALLIGTMIVVTRITVPGFFAASWEVHGARERRKRDRGSMVVSRFIVRAVSAMILIVSLVGSFALMQSLRLAAPQYGRLAIMARVVSYDAPSVVEGMFSPSDTSTR
jgi:hypothetical protein